MRYAFLTLLFLQFSLGAALTTHETEMLKALEEEIHPDMAAIWGTFFSNFNERSIKGWTYSPVTGKFSVELHEPLKLWIESSAKGNEPKKGSVLIFGEKNRAGKTIVEGCLHKDKKTIEFKKGFNIYCKYTIGFATLPITAQVYNFIYQDAETIFLEAGKNGISQKRKKSVQEFMRAWKHPEGVVQGDHVTYLQAKG